MSKSAFVLHEMTEEERIREQARVREMELRDEANAIESAYNEGYAKGYSEGYAKGYAEGYAIGRSEVIKSLMRALNLSAAEAMNAAGIPADEQEKYLSMLN